MWLPNIEAYAQRLRVHAVDVIGEPGRQRAPRGRRWARWHMPNGSTTCSMG